MALIPIPYKPPVSLVTPDYDFIGDAFASLSPSWLSGRGTPTYTTYLFDSTFFASSDAPVNLYFYNTTGVSVIAGNGSDNLVGTTVRDSIMAGGGNDYVHGRGGDDWIFGGDGADRLFGGADNDRLFGNAGNDQLFGGSGDDWLAGGSGINVLAGGTGSDTASFDDTYEGAITASLMTFSAISANGMATATLNGIENLYGSLYDDTLTGDNGANVIDGNAGFDVVRGLGGNDTLYAGANGGRLEGGDGADLLVAGGNGFNAMYGGNDNDIIDATAVAGYFTAHGDAGMDTLLLAGTQDTWDIRDAGWFQNSDTGFQWEHAYDIYNAYGTLLGQITGIEAIKFADGSVIAA